MIRVEKICGENGVQEMLKLIKFLVLLCFAVLGAGFASINPGEVSVHYYFGEIRLPMGVLILGLLGMGIVIGTLASLFPFVRIKHENVTLRRKANLVNEEVKNLRTIPLKDR